MSESITLNTRGLLCPLPVIRTQETVNTLRSGDRLSVVATDPGTMHDIPAWTKVHGHNLLAAKEQNDEFYFLIEVN